MRRTRRISRARSASAGCGSYGPNHFRLRTEPPGHGYAWRTSPLQLFLQLHERAPICALGDDPVGTILDHPSLVQTERVEAHGVLGVVVPPLVVRDVFQGL